LEQALEVFLFLQEMVQSGYQLEVHLLREKMPDLKAYWSEWLLAVCELVYLGELGQAVRLMVLKVQRGRSEVEGLL